MRSRPILAKNNFFWGENSLGYQDFIWKNYLIMKGNGFLKCKNNWLFSSILTTQLSIFIFLLLKKKTQHWFEPKITYSCCNNLSIKPHAFMWKTKSSLFSWKFTHPPILTMRTRTENPLENHKNHPTLVFIPINWVGFQVLLNGWNNQHWQFSFAYVT